jgi:hypothetical protein
MPSRLCNEPIARARSLFLDLLRVGVERARLGRVARDVFVDDNPAGCEASMVALVLLMSSSHWGF